MNISYSFIDNMEENYRAYKLFSIMDVNRDGFISIQEVNRMLMGESVYLNNNDNCGLV